MLSEAEVASYIRSSTAACLEDPTQDEIEFRDGQTDELTTSENAGFILTLVDGSKYQVVVTQTEEGQ